MDDTLITLGNFEIKCYSLFLLFAVMIGIYLLMREGSKHDISKEFMFDLAFFAIVFGFIGARIYFVIFNYSLYVSDPISIFKTWEGGLAIHGGLIAGALTIYFYCKKHKMNFLKIYDIAVIPVLLGQAIGRWGNFFNSEAHGMATTLEHLQNLHIPNFIIEGMYIKGVYYHPTFFYEFIWCILGVIVLYLLRKKKFLKVGQLTAVYLAWYGVGRLFIESMRTDSLMFLGFRVAQLVSIGMIIAGIILFIYLNQKGKYENLYHKEKVLK